MSEAGKRAGHTPLPWRHYDDSEQSTRRHEIVAFGKTVARIYCTKGDEIEDAANAELIVCAVNLFEEMMQALEPFAKAAEHLEIELISASDREPAVYVENGRLTWMIDREAFRLARSILQRAREGKS